MNEKLPQVSDCFDDLLQLWDDIEIAWKKRLKLVAEGANAEGDILFLTAVTEVYGKNIGIEWKNWNKDKSTYECYLSNGGIFK